jgi:GT2 family glycosyltransferase
MASKGTEMRPAPRQIARRAHDAASAADSAFGRRRVSAMARLSIAVGIATAGRAATVAETLAELSLQQRLPDRIVVSTASPEDVPPDASAPGMAIETVLGDRGSSKQRNTILDMLGQEDVVLFIDDDFLMAPDFIARLESLFDEHPDVMAATGRVVADGILGAGLSFAEARTALAQAQPGTTMLTPVNNAYGCNMAFRLAPIRRDGLRFDTRLPLYGWLEDLDFSRKVARHGRCVRADALRGVHLGAKLGRTSGLRLGYSQIANPLYLNAKGTMRRGHALRMMSRNVLANIGKSVAPEPWVDRRGRLRGNCLAIWDLVRGRLDPQRILAMDRGR